MSLSDDQPSARFGEHDIISRYFAPLSAKAPGALGLKDDAALFTPRDGCELVITTDTLVADRHFFKEDLAADIAWKALSVNISDLAAKGAEPRGYFLNISLCPPVDITWLQQFTTGLSEAQKTYDCHLMGGDTVATPGPLTLSITAIGEVPRGKMVMRRTAKSGDFVFVSGTIGDAALALQLRLKTYTDPVLNSDFDQMACIDRLLTRPGARLALAPILRKYASAAMDVSDGLAGDFAKLCAASNLGGVLYGAQIPLSKPVKEALSRDSSLLQTIYSGGDDYEILATTAPSNAELFQNAASQVGVPVHKIGEMKDLKPENPDQNIQFLDLHGMHLTLKNPSYDHF